MEKPAGALLAALGRPIEIAVTPLPKMHMLCLLLLRLGHPLMLKSPYPWLPEGLRGSSDIVNEENLGFWVGLIEGIYAAFICCILFLLVRLSDRVGRKPVLLTCIAGATIMSVFFGMAQSLTSLILLRSLNGMFMGNQAILRLILAETVDDSNSGIGFGLFSAMWQGGSLLAPVVGGLLAHPTRYAIFRNVDLFARFPFLLPCIVAAAVPGFAALLSIHFMHETKPDNEIDHEKYVPLGQDEASSPPPSPRPEGIRSLLSADGIPQILHAWLWIMLSQATFDSVSIVYASTDLDSGGLGMTTTEIGVAMTILAVATTIATVFLFPPLVQRFGALRLSRLTVIATPLAYLTMPLWTSLAAPAGSSQWKVWLAMSLTAALRIPAVMCAQAAEMFAARSAPQRSMNASLNGAISMIGNGMYSIGPLASASLFSLCVHKTGSGVSAFLIYAMCGFMCCATVFRVRDTRRNFEEVERPVP